MSLKHFSRKHEAILFVKEDDPIIDVVNQMVNDEFGAALVMSKSDELLGIFTDRDVVTKVVHAQVDVMTVPISEVMSRDVVTISEVESLDAAIHCIQINQISHLPIDGEHGGVVGMLTIRRLFHDKVTELLNGLRSLEAYLNDAPGG